MRGTIFSVVVCHQHLVQANTIQDELLQPQASMFQTVCLTESHQEVMAVLYIAHQRHISLLSCPPSSRAKQVVVGEEPFTSKIQTVANAYCIVYVVMIAMVVRMPSFLEYV
jgi:hypothetical protein